jgi:phosphoribosylaminoimidazole carboxylase (NCAIR synthetase)
LFHSTWCSAPQQNSHLRSICLCPLTTKNRTSHTINCWGQSNQLPRWHRHTHCQHHHLEMLGQ